MSNFLFVYHGGTKPASEEAMTETMARWQAWFGGMGEAVVDGGAPVGLSSTVNSDGSVSADGGANPVSGYSIVSAENAEAAIEMAKGCPILSDGGSIEVAETMQM